MQPIQWPLWRRLLFRFFFIYIALLISPWNWLDSIPWISKYITTPIYNDPFDWLVRKSNALVFHIKDELVPVAGSGDTSWGWAALCFTLALAFIGMIIWSILDRHRKQYVKLNFWLILFTRYYVALVCFQYGIIKIFGVQMVFPSYSQLATPLGDFLPMRFSWLFIGYSTPYQFFSGLMEVLAGVLLLYRRTATLGSLIAAGVFIHVAILNLSYDIPVKIYSMQMVVLCLFLIANEMNRILCFFVLNRPANVCSIYHTTYPNRWMKISRVVLKLGFIYLAVWMVAADSWSRRSQMKSAKEGMVFKEGSYDVIDYVLNGDTVPPLLTDTLRWQNVIFDSKRSGSIATKDTALWQWYSRGYFRYKVDTTQKTLQIFRPGKDTLYIADLHYNYGTDGALLFNGRKGKDSLILTLRRSTHNFPLAEKQFNWMTEQIR